jgi:hypothetical protein
MKLTLFNDKSIYINEAWVREFHAQHEPSFMSKRISELQKPEVWSKFCLRLLCLAKTQAKIYDHYRTYLDIMGGTGITARVFQRELDDTYVNDLDPFSQVVLHYNFKTENITQKDIMDFDWRMYKYDTVFLDYNDFTFTKYLMQPLYRLPVNNAFEHANHYIIINDCSVFYLRYGEKSYNRYSDLLDRKVTNKDEFFRALRAFYKVNYPKWNLINIESVPTTSYLLFSRAPKPLEITYHDTGSLTDFMPVRIEDDYAGLESFVTA